MRRSALALASIAAIVASAALLVACGDDSDDSAAGTASTTAAAAPLADALPEELRGKPLKVSFGVGYPPMGFTDDAGELTGVNIDLAKAVGEKLGVEVEPSVVAFETVIPGIQSGKFDASFFGAVVNPERLEILDMATYVTDGDTFVTTEDHPDVGSEETDLCGRRIAIVAGNAALPNIEKLSSECESSGAGAIDILTFPNNSEANLAVQGDKADIALSPVSVAGYLSKENPDFRITGPRLGALKISAIAEKGNGVGEALQAGINALIEDGTYQEILERYGASANAVERSELNPSPN